MQQYNNTIYYTGTGAQFGYTYSFGAHNMDSRQDIDSRLHSLYIEIMRMTYTSPGPYAVFMAKCDVATLLLDTIMLIRVHRDMQKKKRTLSGLGG